MTASASASGIPARGNAAQAARRITEVTTRAQHFHLLPGETLLEGLERTGHDVEYQCRSGYCGLCRLTLIQGSVDYPEPPLAFIAPGDILPCCCRLLEPVAVDCHRRTDLDSQGELFRTDLLDDQ